MNQDQKHRKVDSIKYGDVFDIHGELAPKPIAPQDAAALESAENLVLGEIPEGALSSLMKSAAEVNERRGFVRHDEMTDIIRDEGPTISETTVVGHRIISESIGGQDDLLRERKWVGDIMMSRRREMQALVVKGGRIAVAGGGGIRMFYAPK